MRSRGKGARRALVVAAGLFAAALACRPAPAAAQAPATDAARPGDPEIEQALEQVRADPNLSPERKVRTLRWIGSEQQQTPVRSPWLIWIAQTAMWVADSARRFLRILGAVLLGMVVVYLLRRRTRRLAAAEITFIAPTHVRDLDIRPETLPDDIGAAARALWESGDRRAALALLYRGMLSRLIHVHRMPIRESSTEGDCLELAARHLTETPRQYAAGLIRAWQRFVYGGEELQPTLVLALCDGFAGALDGAAADRLRGASA